jgi:hypothetical protein
MGNEKSRHQPTLVHSPTQGRSIVGEGMWEAIGVHYAVRVFWTSLIVVSKAKSLEANSLI